MVTQYNENKYNQEINSIIKNLYRYTENSFKRKEIQNIIYYNLINDLIQILKDQKEELRTKLAVANDGISMLLKYWNELSNLKLSLSNIDLQKSNITLQKKIHQLAIIAIIISISTIISGIFVPVWSDYVKDYVDSLQNSNEIVKNNTSHIKSTINKSFIN